jgi:hypothetical protein
MASQVTSLRSVDEAARTIGHLEVFRTTPACQDTVSVTWAARVDDTCLGWQCLEIPFLLSSPQLGMTCHGGRRTSWTVRGCPTFETAEIRVRMMRAGRSSNISLPLLYDGRVCVMSQTGRAGFIFPPTACHPPGGETGRSGMNGRSEAPGRLLHGILTASRSRALDQPEIDWQ